MAVSIVATKVNTGTTLFCDGQAGTKVDRGDRVIIQRSPNDVLLLEKKTLTAGCTWHAAGLLGQMRSKVNLTRLMQYSAKLCETIGAEVDQDVGWRNVGSLRLASSDARWEELKRAATAAKSYGFDLELVGPNEVKNRFPLVDLKNVRGATWIASDGYVDLTASPFSVASTVL